MYGVIRGQIEWEIGQKQRVCQEQSQEKENLHWIAREEDWETSTGADFDEKTAGNERRDVG